MSPFGFRGDVTIVGLSGKKRSGKDTFASTLIAERGFRRVSFADNVRQGALDLDPIIRFEEDEWHLSVASFEAGPRYERLSAIVDRIGWEAAKEIREVRRTLQRFGSESIRKLDPEFWVRAAMMQAHATPGPVVITDVRFENEAKAVTDAGGVVVRITRPGLESADEHPSETALDAYPWDLEVLNDGTVEQLAETARHLLF